MHGFVSCFLAFYRARHVRGLLGALCVGAVGVSLVLKSLVHDRRGPVQVGFGSLSLAMALNMAPLKVPSHRVLAASFCCA